MTLSADAAERFYPQKAATRVAAVQSGSVAAALQRTSPLECGNASCRFLFRAVIQAYDSGMTVDTRLSTADELLRLPDDGSRYELVEGELLRMSPAGGEHGSIGALILGSLIFHTRQHRLGVVYNAETGFLLSRSPDTVRVPDVAFVRTERVVKTKGYLPGAPDLAIEVISPSDLYSEVVQKTDQYLRAGTRAVIVVDPGKRLVQIHRLSGTETVTTTLIDVLSVDDVVPGWKLPLDEIFEA